MPIFYPSDHPSTIVRPEERHWSPSARKDELQGRARKSECPKRSVATQVFRISASAARLSAWVTVALTFFCLLFLCQDKKRRSQGKKRRCRSHQSYPRKTIINQQWPRGDFFMSSCTHMHINSIDLPSSCMQANSFHIYHRFFHPYIYSWIMSIYNSCMH